ncbi:GGDEF domain-containing protein [Pseudomonas sp. 3A(2025)]
MSDDAERWKEKYLKGIEQQDRLEKRWQERLDLLRRGLVRSSLAAEGTDRSVDVCMKEMREIVRKDDMDVALAGLIPRLEKAVLDSEQRREVRIGQISSALTELVAQLQALPLPRDVRKPLKRFAKGLEERAAQARELPLLLGELKELQRKALGSLEHADEPARPGLLQRLFGGREESAEPPPVQPAPAFASALAAAQTEPPAPVPANEAPVHEEPVHEAPVNEDRAPDDEPPQVVAPQAVPVVVDDEPGVTEPASLPPDALHEEPLAEPVESPPLEPAAIEPEVVEASASVEEIEPEAEAEIEAEAEAEAVQALESADAEYDLPTSPEPSYSSVAAHIEQTLLGLLGDLNLPEHHRPQAEALRQRLEHGLNWYELLPILDDLAVFMLAITDSGQHEFEAYLKQLNERLDYFQSSLRVVSDGHAASHTSARDFDSQLREHVDDLQSHVQDASDLPSLKRVLENRLEGLIGAMDAHQRQRDEREQEVAERLQGLASRVASMEQEALGFRANLEEQRRKALIDPLTGLPNRAAWGERLEREIALWQQNRNSLLLCIMDLDHFKRINDGYGHLAGDKVLKIVAKVLHNHLHGRGFLARFGGEEFVLLMPATPVETGLQLLEELRARVEVCPFHFKGEPVTITVSTGMTVLRSGERSDVALKRADQALYRAKENGRNRVEQG